MLMVPWLFFHAHYYYLSLAIVPLNALLVRYLIEIEAGRGWTRLGIWACAYVLLGAFVIPPSVLSRLFGLDFWQLYMQNAVYFFGEMLLLGLVLWEYLTLPPPASRLAA